LTAVSVEPDLGASTVAVLARLQLDLVSFRPDSDLANLTGDSWI